MNKISVIGLNLAKNVFQIHAVDEDGGMVLRKQLSRTQMPRYFANLSPCLVSGWKPAVALTTGTVS